MPSATELPPDLSNPQYSPSRVSFPMPKNPKIIILIAMGILILVLLFFNFLFSSSRKNPQNINPTPSPVLSTPTPTILPVNIPTQFQDPLNQIDQLLQPESDFLPPELNPQIN